MSLKNHKGYITAVSIVERPNKNVIKVVSGKSITNFLSIIQHMRKGLMREIPVKRERLRPY